MPRTSLFKWCSIFQVSRTTNHQIHTRVVFTAKYSARHRRLSGIMAPRSRNRGIRHNTNYTRAAESQVYNYTPLDASKNEIRLLRLLYSPDGALRCQLFHTPHNEAPPYHALSYSWGDKNSLTPLHLESSGSESETDTRAIFVTANLKHALRRLRPKEEGEELIIWVDALCIDQKNTPERNVQVRRMRAIYENAQKLCVWIGLKNDGSSEAIQLVRTLNTCSPEDVASILQDPATTYPLEALVTLFRRNYWWRIWVIQEVLCAEEATVYCGEESISWTELDKVCDIMKEHEDLLLKEMFYNHLSKIRTLTYGGPRGLQLSRYAQSAHEPPLLDLLLSHKSKQSTDPRDKVYALVGISSSRETFGTMNYSLTMREVYSHTARHIISTTNKLDVLCVRQGYIDQFNLPSWVPNWTRKPLRGGHALTGLHHRLPPFTAAGDTAAMASFSDDGYVLRAQGMVVDRIKLRGIAFVKDGHPRDMLPALQVYHDWRERFIIFKDQSPSSDVEFGKIVSGGTWQFENATDYTSQLRLISSLPTNQRSPVSQTSSQGALSESWEYIEDEQPPNIITTEEQKEAMAAISSASLMMNGRRLIITERDVTGLGPMTAADGDLVCVLLGCRFPVVLRKNEETEGYSVIGEAFVNGFMEGEALQAGFKLDTFEIH